MVESGIPYQNAEKELFGLLSFRASIVIPLIISLTLSFMLLLNDPLRWDFTYNGTNFFLNFFKVPLGILALIFPSVALVASNHRSRQQARLILLQTSQNIFANHYTHMDNFEKHCRRLSIFQDSFLSKHNVRIFHSIIFPKSKEGDYSLNREFLSKFGKKNAELFATAIGIHNDFRDKKIDQIQAETMLSDFILEILKLVLFVHGESRIPIDHLVYLSDLLLTMTSISEVIQAMTEFDEKSKYHFESNYFTYFINTASEILKDPDIFIEEYKNQFNWTVPDAAEMYSLFGGKRTAKNDI